MAGYKANTNPKTDHTRKVYHDQEVRVSILYKTNGSKVKCGCIRDSQGGSYLIVDASGTPIPYSQIPYNTPTPTEHTQ